MATTTVVLGSADKDRLADLCRGCTAFFELVQGQAGGPSTADEILGPLPSHVTSGTKRVLGVERGTDLVGVAEILDGFPGPDEWQIGLLLILPELRGGGLGTEIWQGIRDLIQGRGGRLIRLIVQKQNPAARRFWEKNGFSVERESTVKVGKLSSPVWVMLLRLA